MIIIVRARVSWELWHFPYGTMCPLSHTNRPPLLFVFELRGTPTAFRENFEEVSSAQGACWNWPHLSDCIVGDSCTPRWRFSACHEKEGGRTSLLARSKQNKIPDDPLTLNSWWKTGKEIKLQARRLTAINLPTLCPCKKKKKKTTKCEELRNEQHFTRAYWFSIKPFTHFCLSYKWHAAFPEPVPLN